jgi:hypothetical protein
MGEFKNTTGAFLGRVHVGNFQPQKPKNKTCFLFENWRATGIPVLKKNRRTYLPAFVCERFLSFSG